MHSGIPHLIELQRVDHRIAALRAELETFPKRMRETDLRLSGARAEIAAAREAHAKAAAERNLHAIDATCPLVTKVHLEAIRFAREGYTILLIGHEGHDEVLGTMGEAPANIVLVQDAADVERLDVPEGSKLAYLTQTTLSVDDAELIIDALRRRFPQIIGPSRDDICYATQNRQEAVKELVPEADVVLVLGSRNSSNSMRLEEIARSCGKPAYLIDRAGEIDDRWFQESDTVLITAGASAPEEVVQECVAYLQRRYGATEESRTIREEHVSFPLPRELRVLAPSSQN